MLSVRVSPETFAALDGRNKTELIEAGLEITIPSLGHEMPGTDECLLAYHAISRAIQRLEISRDGSDIPDLDTPELWTPEEKQLHALLSGFWDALRVEPTFTEKQLPEYE